MFGRISNFQWSYNTDTTYDCSFDVMGYGSVIESLSALSSENIAGSESDSSDGKTTIGNKFAKLLDFGIESDPFIIVPEETDGVPEENPNDTKTDPNIKPERNAKIAAVIHYACEDGEISPVYSDIEDSIIKKKYLDDLNNLQEGDVFEFVGGRGDPRYNKTLKFVKRSAYDPFETANFIVVKVFKGDEFVLGYTRTQFSGETREVLRDQPSQNTRLFKFVPERIKRDEGKTIKYLKRIGITPDSQKFLNETYSEFVPLTEKQKVNNATTASVSPITGNTITTDTSTDTPGQNVETPQTNQTESMDAPGEVDIPPIPSPFYNQSTQEEKVNVQRKLLLSNDVDYGGYKKINPSKYTKDPANEVYTKPLAENNGKFKGKLMVAFLNTETAEVYYRQTKNNGKLR